MMKQALHYQDACWNTSHVITSDQLIIDDAAAVAAVVAVASQALTTDVEVADER